MDLSKMCRVCLLSDDIVHLLDWHQPIESLEYVLSYKECFCKCTQINLSLKDDPTDTEDTRTQYLCFCCAQSLKDAHEFIEKAKRADNELRSRQIDKNFEWVAVSAKEVATVLKEDPVVDDKNCLDEINEANIWNNQTTDEKGVNITINIDEEDITIANLKKELEEHSLAEKRKPATKTKHKTKVEIIDENTKSEDDGDDEDFLEDAEIASSKESDQDTFSERDFKAVPKKKDAKKIRIKTPRKIKTDPNEMMTCELCQKVIKKRTLEKHLERHEMHKKKIKPDPNELMTCELCQIVIKRSSLKKHLQRHEMPKRPKADPEDMMTCEVCQKVMKRSTLKKHKQRHKPKTFLCKACPKVFSDSNALKNHEAIHDENRERYKCDKCEQTFLSRFTFRRHAQVHVANRKPEFQCQLCPKVFLQKSGLMTHMLHHEGPKWKCTLCEKKYVRRADLETHIRTHSGEAPFRCKLCARTFIHKRILNRHMQHHEGFYRYTCITCGQQFDKYDKYYTHRQQHYGLAYKCGICEKQFFDAYKTKRHVKGVHKIFEDSEVKKFAVKVNETKEYRGRIIECLKNPDDVAEN